MSKMRKVTMATVALLLLMGLNVLSAQSYTCEGTFRPSYECYYGLDANWNTLAAVNAYGDSGAIIQDHAIPPGAIGARWIMKVINNNPQIAIRAYYWDYVSSSWVLFYNVPINMISAVTYTIPLPSNSLNSTPLRTKIFLRNAVSPAQSAEYYEGVIDWQFRPCGDVDCNNIITISDAVYLINYIFAGGPAPCAVCE